MNLADCASTSLDNCLDEPHCKLSGSDPFGKHCSNYTTDSKGIPIAYCSCKAKGELFNN